MAVLIAAFNRDIVYERKYSIILKFFLETGYHGWEGFCHMQVQSFGFCFNVGFCSILCCVCLQDLHGFVFYPATVDEKGLHFI